MPKNKKETGITFLGILFLLVLGGLLAYVAMRVAPMYIEFWTIEKTLQDLADKAKVENYTAAEMRKSFDKILDVNSITIVNSRDLSIETGKEGTTLSVSYTKCAPLIDRLEICGNFEPTITFQTN